MSERALGEKAHALRAILEGRFESIGSQHEVSAASHEIPQRILLSAGRPDRCQFARSVQSGQHPTVVTLCLDPVA